MHRRRLITLLIGLFACAASTARADLRAYVEREDDSFAWEIVARHPVGNLDGYTIKLTSQTWRGITWTHWLSILVPEQLEHPDAAILLITGGSNGKAAPDPGTGAAAMLAAVAEQCGVVLAVLQQVPNQPLLDGLKEDALISETFQRYLDSNGDPAADDWPLLLPMVKSAVAAMDATQAIGGDVLDLDIDRFIITGASKRGWTTWLTAAADERVCAIAPMVIDMLNFGPQLQQQSHSYGGASEKIGDYAERGILERFDTEPGQRLVAIVDPFVYRQSLTLPKLILLGTNDPYWTVDAANLYFDELPGDKHLFYLPNAGHRLGPGIMPTLAAFFRASLAGETLPELTWQRGDDGTLSVQWDQPNATATLWSAHNDSRDFRQATWQARPLPGRGQVEIPLTPPATGWTASFVQVQFHSPTHPAFGLSTSITVLPESFPHAAEAQGAGR